MKRLTKMITAFCVAMSLVVTVVPVYAQNQNEVIFEESDKISEEEIIAFENGDLDMELVDTVIEDIDDEFYAKIEIYESDTTVARSAWTRVKRNSKYFIYNKNTGKKVVVFNLLGKFKYNGKTSVCTDSYNVVNNKNESVFEVITEEHMESGNTAIFYCLARNKKNGKKFGATKKITVSATGQTTYS